LQRRGQLSNTLVVVTADHGEEFGEHGWFSHGNGLYLQGLHVPLLISFPGRIPGGVRVSERVTLRDLPATVIDLLGSAGAPVLPGRSLVGFWGQAPNSSQTGASPLVSEVRRARNAHPWYAVSRGDMQSIIVGRHHYIRNGDGREELYDVVADPSEKRDLAHSPDSGPVIEACRAALVSAIRNNARSATGARLH
jgi:arylsulfatase A-like enzyme